VGALQQVSVLLDEPPSEFNIHTNRVCVDGFAVPPVTLPLERQAERARIVGQWATWRAWPPLKDHALRGSRENRCGLAL